MEKRIKMFKDLQIGDSIYVEFEKKIITKIIKYTPNFWLDTICTSDGKQYEVHCCLSDDYECKELVRVYTEKEAIILYYERKLEEWRANCLNYKSYCEEQIERAERL